MAVPAEDLPSVDPAAAAAVEHDEAAACSASSSVLAVDRLVHTDHAQHLPADQAEAAILQAAVHQELAAPAQRVLLAEPATRAHAFARLAAAVAQQVHVATQAVVEALAAKALPVAAEAVEPATPAVAEAPDVESALADLARPAEYADLQAEAMPAAVVQSAAAANQANFGHRSVLQHCTIRPEKS